MGGTYTESGGKGEVRETKPGYHFLDQPFKGFSVAYPLPQVNMKGCPTRIFGLQIVLEYERLEDIVRVVNRELGRVGVERS